MATLDPADDPTVLGRIQSYAKASGRTIVQDASPGGDADRSSESYVSQLDAVIQNLQSHLAQQRADLARLKQNTRSPLARAPSNNPSTHIRQLRAIKLAYSTLATTKPLLPAPDSVIPSLLAARELSQVISTTKTGIDKVESQRQSLAAQIGREEAALSDAKLLTEHLRRRTTELRAATAQRQSQPSSDLAKAQVETKKELFRTSNRSRLELENALHEFISLHLGPAILTEESGGAVIGTGLEQSDVDENERLGADRQSDGQRQRRIDELWGTAGQGSRLHNKGANGPISSDESLRAEFEDLIKRSLEALHGEDTAGGYIELSRDSAGARFLVRARAGAYHPRDARKFRLTDFGRNFDD